MIFPISTLLIATAAIRHALAQIKEAGTPAQLLDHLPRFGEFLEFIGLAEIHDLERRFTS